MIFGHALNHVLYQYIGCMYILNTLNIYMISVERIAFVSKPTYLNLSLPIFFSPPAGLELEMQSIRFEQSIKIFKYTIQFSIL